MKVVTLGDSLAYGAGDEADGGIAGRLKKLLKVETVNLGVNGAQTADLMSRLRQDRVRTQLADADAIVLSIGANDLFRTPNAREETMRDPMGVANRILGRIEKIVDELHRDIAPDARILILGGYNPVPAHPLAMLLGEYIRLWDTTLAARFAKNPNVSIVTIADLVVPGRLSRYDSFHPGAEAYAEAAKRIAGMLMEDERRLPAGRSAAFQAASRQDAGAPES